MDLRSTAREIFLDTLQRLELGTTMRRKLLLSRSALQIGENCIDLTRFRHLVVIAIGKAAVPMSSALLEILQPAFRDNLDLEGIVIGSTLPSNPLPNLHYRLGSHPLPNAASIESARLTLELLGRCHAESLVFFLISGGASAMFEHPLDPAISLDQLVAFHRALVHSGLPIAEMNTLRKHLSSVKGGRLAVAAGEATMCTLLISDVQPATPEIIGSGPSLPDASTVADCRDLLNGPLANCPIPAGIRAWFARKDCPETPKPGSPAFRNATWHTLLSSDDLCAAAAASAQAMGFHVEVDLRCDEWEYRDAANYLLQRLHAMPHDREVCLISGGELAVPIMGDPGIGGRNGQFALECARRLSGDLSNTTVLSAGSDGLDGNSPAAGAVVDSTTAARATEQGLAIDDALATFNAYPLLHAIGDTIITGPSANNLRDLRLLLRTPSTALAAPASRAATSEEMQSANAPPRR